MEAAPREILICEDSRGRQPFTEWLESLTLAVRAVVEIRIDRIEDGNFAAAWGGIASVSVALSAVWTGMRRRGFSLSDLARLMSQQPAQLAGLAGKKGRIAPGYDADFVVFSPDAERTVTEDQLHTRDALSPYIGQRLFGTVTATYLRGNPVFENARFSESPLGREITP